MNTTPREAPAACDTTGSRRLIRHAAAVILLGALAGYGAFVLPVLRPD